MQTPIHKGSQDTSHVSIYVISSRAPKYPRPHLARAFEWARGSRLNPVLPSLPPFPFCASAAASKHGASASNPTPVPGPGPVRVIKFTSYGTVRDLGWAAGRVRACPAPPITTVTQSSDVAPRRVGEEGRREGIHKNFTSYGLTVRSLELQALASHARVRKHRYLVRDAPRRWAGPRAGAAWVRDWREGKGRAKEGPDSVAK
ncbi:hypothetical protein DFH09DRAFT_1073910 [Mycena vulgaris]|nr:hypothetical protein DFH09DRAFT_1073910 [Mycena vulgaris]